MYTTMRAAVLVLKLSTEMASPTSLYHRYYSRRASELGKIDVFSTKRF